MVIGCQIANLPGSTCEVDPRACASCCESAPGNAQPAFVQRNATLRERLVARAERSGLSPSSAPRAKR